MFNWIISIWQQYLKHLNVKKLLVLDSNTWNHLTVYKD